MNTLTMILYMPLIISPRPPTPAPTTMQYHISKEIEDNMCITLPITPSDKLIHIDVFYRDHRLFTHNREAPDHIHALNCRYPCPDTPNGLYVCSINRARTWVENGRTLIRFAVETIRADGFPHNPTVPRPPDLRPMDYETAALDHFSMPNIYTLYIDSYNKRRYLVEVTKDTMTCIVELSGVDLVEYAPLIDMFREIYKTGDRDKIYAAPFLRRAIRDAGSSLHHSGYNIYYENANYRAIRTIGGNIIISGTLIKSIAEHALSNFPKGAFVWFPDGA